MSYNTKESGNDTQPARVGGHRFSERSGDCHHPGVRRPDRLVFDVLTKPEHVSKWFAPFDCQMKECSIDLRPGGSYHQVFVTQDGTECSFRGIYLEVEPPARTVATWLFEGWPDAEAVESVDLHETDGVTTLTMTLTFRDKAGRAHITKSDGQEDSFDKMEDYLRSLLTPKGAAAG